LHFHAVCEVTESAEIFLLVRFVLLRDFAVVWCCEERVVEKLAELMNLDAGWHARRAQQAKALARMGQHCLAQVM